MKLHKDNSRHVKVVGGGGKVMTLHKKNYKQLRMLRAVFPGKNTAMVILYQRVSLENIHTKKHYIDKAGYIQKYICIYICK